eukprot:1072063_1
MAHNGLVSDDHKEIDTGPTNTTTSKRYCFVDIKSLHEKCNLQIKDGCARKIRITNVEEKHSHLPFSTSYTTYTLVCDPPIINGVDLIVSRRYNDFKWLRAMFVKCFPSLFIPPIPPKQILGRFEKSFVAQRRKDLQRFLNRICQIKPLSESLLFTVFLSRPEDTFNVSKQEIEQHHVPTVKDKILFLSKTFPDYAIVDKYISDYIDSTHIDFHQVIKTRSVPVDDQRRVIMEYKQSADDLIFGAEISECYSFVKKVCDQLGALCGIQRKLNDKLLKLQQSTKAFHEAFWTLHTVIDQFKNKTTLPADAPLSLFGDDKRDFYGWYNYNATQCEVHEHFFWIHLNYQYEDMNAFMDIFSNRNRLIVEFVSITARNKTWQNLIEAEYELQPHQKTQIQMDYKLERLLRYLLMISTKVIINYNVYKIWNDLIRDWKEMIARYTQSQILAHQMLHAECYLEDSDDDDDDDTTSCKGQTKRVYKQTNKLKIV